MGRTGVCEVCAFRHDDSFDSDVFHLCGVAWLDWLFSAAVSSLIANTSIKRTNIHSQPNTNQRHARIERSVPRLTQTTRPRTYGQPIQFSSANPHQAFPGPLRARKHALGTLLGHRHCILASDVRLPHRLALPTFLPDLRHRRHRVGNRWRDER